MNLIALQAEALSSVSFLRPYLRLLTCAAVYGLVFSGVVGLFQDIEYADYDESNALVACVKKYCSGPYTAPIASDSSSRKNKNNQLPLFDCGPVAASIKTLAIAQGAVFDCRFIATVASFTASDAGKAAICSNIKLLDDGSYTVFFPGIKQTIAVSKLTEREIALYAKNRDFMGNKTSLWLPVLEKAYGQYRNTHLDLLGHIRRFVRHVLFEGRFTSQSLLPGFGAAYGACDDQGAFVLSGRNLKEFTTYSFECGEGLGKSYVTFRQIASWFNSKSVFKDFVSEQDRALCAMPAGGIAIATTELNGNCAAYGLNPAHAYAVLFYDRKRRILLLKDPYGRGDLHTAGATTARDGVDDGIFAINLTDFNYLFSHLRVAQAR